MPVSLKLESLHMSDLKVVEKEFVHADFVGNGVLRERGPKPRSSPKEIPLDLPVEWIDTPSVPNQIFDAQMARVDRMQVYVYDLNCPEHVAAYEKLLTTSLGPLSNMLIVHDESKFNEKSGSWKTLVKVQVFKFKKVIHNTTKPVGTRL